MFFALFACHLALAAANPFHKYPFVFLLDIGNEELEKTNTEQIRVSSPGGSLALRYPALGDGDTIAHVRVSGIDFGTDLKANIVDGGPGSKYVTLVFMGNPGVPYDAVMTIQTVPDSDINSVDINNLADVSDSGSIANDNNNSAEVLDEDQNGGSNETNEEDDVDDFNDSSEDLSDGVQSSNVDNAEVAEESADIYKYANNADNYEDDNDGTVNGNVSDQDEQAKDHVDDSDISDEEEEDQDVVEINQSEFNSASSDINNDADSSIDDDVPISDNQNFYETYQALKPNLYDGVRIYPQNAVPFMIRQNSEAYNQESNEVEQIFDDEESHNPEKFKDTNNNYFDSDDNSAVAS